MTIPNYWSEEWLRDEYVNKGRTKHDIATTEDVGPATIQKYLTRFGIKKRGDDRKYKDEEWLRSQREAGESVRSMAREAGCNHSTIVKYLNEFGID